MALIGLFKKESPQDREPSLRDKGQILAYLEELFRIRSAISIKLAEDSDLAFAGKVELVNEEKGSFTISLQNRPSQEPKEGAIIFFYFTMDRMRFRTQARFMRRGGYMQSEFALPEAIIHAERRSLVRIRFSRREPAKAVALEGLFDGLGISGPIINLSLGGICLRVDRVIDIKRDKRLQARSELFAPGASLALIRLQDLPLSPNLECSGHIRHVDARGEGIYLGIELGSMGAFEHQTLTKIITQKIPGWGAGFPRKRRRGELDSGDQESPEADFDSEEIQPPTEAEEALEDSEIKDLTAIIKSPNRLALLRRRSRNILIVISEELERTVLLGTLYVDGYRNIHEASGLVQALRQFHKHAFDAIIIDQQVGKHSGLEIIQQLRSNGLLNSTKVIVLKSLEEVKLKVAKKAGGIDLCVSHPVDFDGILKPELERLLDIN